MIRVFLILLLCSISQAADLRRELLKASPIASRSGCPNAARKLQAGGPFTIAFLGGSITENHAGFSSSIPAWLRQKFPSAKIKSINAGWGGTGSELGAQRLDSELLPQKPDLVIVEFAVNDIAKPESVHMERIVHKLWMANAETDIIFLYTLNKGDLEFYRKGLFPLSVSRHEHIAMHYAVPMIAAAETIAADLLSNRLAWSDFSNDTCHPHARGYTRYTAAITSALDLFLATGTPGPHSLPAPFTPDLVVHPPRIPASPPIPPSPMREEDGRKATLVFELPQIGTEWVASPDFKMWRLYCQPSPHALKLDSTAGLSRTHWHQRIGWIDEAGFFTGLSHRWIAGGRRELAGRIGSNSKESAVVTFTVPKTGEYRLEIRLGGIGGYSMQEKEIALHVVHFSRNAEAGKSLHFIASSRATMRPLGQHCLTHLAAGDEIAFVFLPHQVGGGAFFSGFTARFGLLPAK